MKKIFNKYVVNYFIFSLCVLLLCEYFYKISNYNMFLSFKELGKDIINYPIIFVFILLLIMLVNVGINCLVKKSRTTKIIILILFGLIMFINDVKYHIMGIPIQISDIASYVNLDGIDSMGSASKTSIGIWIIYTIIKLFIFLGIGSLFVIFDKKIIINKKYRLFGIPCFLIITLLISFVNFNKYTLEIRNSSLTSISEIYDKYGLFGGIFLDCKNDNDYEPIGYNKEEIIDYVSNTNETKWEKANIVFILFEAFSDIQNINEITFDRELTPNIEKYKNMSNAMVMDLNVYPFGGTSVNSEFEILTGASISFWKTGYLPYTLYYNEETTKYSPNIIKELNNNGYETMYLTPWGQYSYKSKYVYNLLGIDNTIYSYNCLSKQRANRLSDIGLMDKIYEELKKGGNYKFIMTATSQNHFPFLESNYDDYQVKVTNSEYNEEDTGILLSYAEGIYEADYALNYLYELIQNLDTPTIIVFFGDHLPYTVNSKSDNPYLESSYFNTDNQDLNYLRKHTTKGVVLSNYDISTDNLEYINLNYLGSYIINKMDLNISNYFINIDNYRKQLPVFNKNSAVIDNNIIDINTNNELKEIYNNYSYLQYRYFYDYED